MKKFLSVTVFCCVFFAAQTFAQTASPTPTPTTASTTTTASKTNQDAAQMPEKPKRAVFRATKDQIRAAQDYLKQKSMFTGETDGTMSDPMRESVKTFQENNGLKKTGSLNRATLEKMNIPLTDTQKAMPYDESKYTASETQTPEGGKTKRAPVFRATKEQVAEAQKMLKDKGLLTEEPTGKLDDATRAALRKFQEQNGVKVTGTLNRVTLEKMNIALTDRQKAISN